MAKKTARKKSAAPPRRPAAKTTKPAKGTRSKPARTSPKQKTAAKAAPAKRAPATGKAASRRSPVAERQTVVSPPAVAGGVDGPVVQEGKLTAKDVEQFRHMLLEKRAEILGDVTTLHDEALNKNRTDASGDLSSMPIHMADLGTDNYELEFTLGLIEGERAMLKEIDEALERIKGGTYGLCLATGQPIGRARLRAKPWAKYCYEYTLAQERGQGRGP